MQLSSSLINHYVIYFSEDLVPLNYIPDPPHLRSNAFILLLFITKSDFSIIELTVTWNSPFYF